MEKKNYLLYILIIICISLSIATIVATVSQTDTSNAEKFTLYVGTNDKDTLKPIMPKDDAMRLVEKVCAKHVESFTLSEGQGHWVNDDNNLTDETTIIITIFETPQQQVYDIMEELIIELNQESILLEKQETTIEFFTGQ